MRHVYFCTYWNTEKEEIEYDMIFTDHISQQRITQWKFRHWSIQIPVGPRVHRGGWGAGVDQRWCDDLKV